MDKLKALAESSHNQYFYRAPDATLLEYFPSPFNVPGSTGKVHIKIPEFTSLCPVTGQPDFATIIIDYEPGERCVESKSLKLYMGSFRNHGEFHEGCVNRVCQDLVNLLHPKSIQVEGRFTPRGGIPIWPTSSWSQAAASDD